jgi:UTP--glucose-1-phosphate uridylyltransferase
MIEIHENEGAHVLAVQEVETSAIPSYGIVSPAGAVEGDRVRIASMVEKPTAEDAPSNLAARGRYLFNPSIFDAIEETSEGVGGEIQLTDAINLLAQREPVFAYIHRGPILDVGKKLDYLKASIELALRRPDLSDDLGAWLRERASRL